MYKNDSQFWEGYFGKVNSEKKKSKFIGLCKQSLDSNNGGRLELR